MSVPRHTNAYGKTLTTKTNYCYYKQLGINGQWSSQKVEELANNKAYSESVRLFPVNGVWVDGFRKPTNWGLVARRTTYGAYDEMYLNSLGTLYHFYGTGPGLRRGTPKPNGNGYTSTGTSVTVNVPANQVNRTRTEALLKIKAGNINIGVALGESKTTLRFLVASVTRLIAAYRAARVGNWKRAGRFLGFRGWRNSASNPWLEYQYGWMPLFSDIYGAQQQLKDGFRERDQLFSVVRQTKVHLNLMDFLQFSDWAGKPEPDTLTGSAEFVCKVKYYQKVSNEHLLALNDLGLVNPLVIAWELVPFSFVIDWLLPVGNFLDGLTSTLGTTFVGGYEDRICQCDIKWSHRKSENSHQQFAFQRIAKASWDLPVPYWKNPFTTTHVISAIALLLQLRK